MQVNGQGFPNAPLKLEDYKVRLLIERLKTRERQVIAHEMAHKAAGGQYTGTVRYTYTKGPDGRYYITGGEVPIDTSPESDPEATIRKMEIVRAAALAPADPSPQDLAVAQRATVLEMKARQELALKKYKEKLENPVGAEEPLGINYFT